jgi:hypothetical protein
MRRARSTYGGDEMYIRFKWAKLRERDHLENPDIDVRIILRWIAGKWDEGARTGFIWLRIGTGGGFL